MEARPNETLRRHSVQPCTDAKEIRANRGHDNVSNGAFDELLHRFQQTMQPGQSVTLLCF